MVCTRPKYQYCSVTALMMQWGVSQTDKLQVEILIEGAVDVRDIYQNSISILTSSSLTSSSLTGHKAKQEGEVSPECKRLQDMFPSKAIWVWSPNTGMPLKAHQQSDIFPE
jgi:hypothetical protein